MIAEVGGHAGETWSILDRLGDALGLAQVPKEIAEAAHGIQALPQFDADIEIPIVDLTARREPPQRAQGLFEAGHRLLMRGAHGGLTACHVEKERGLLPRFAVSVVRAERKCVCGEVVGVDVFQALGHPTVQRHPKRGRQLARRDLSDVVVDEFEPVPGPAQHAMANELLYALGRLSLGHIRRTLDEREVKLATDHGRHRYQSPSELRQTLQALPHKFAHSLWKGKSWHP